MSRLHLVIPAYNEAANLPGLFERIAASTAEAGTEYTAWVVDDGSADDTAAVAGRLAGRYPIKLLSHERNRGLEGVFLTGMRAAVAAADDDDGIVVLEGDGTSDPEVFPAMLAAFEDPCDVVIASRYVGEGKYLNFPLKRLLLSRGANWMLGTVCRLPGVRDYTIFYRLYRARVLRKALEVFGDRFTSVGGFACNAEMLLRMRRFVRQTREVPLVYDYAKKKGASGMKIGGNLLSYLALFRIFAFEDIDGG